MSPATLTEITIAGTTVSAHICADGTWAVKDATTATLFGVSSTTIRKRAMELKHQNAGGNFWIERYGTRHWTRAGLIELAHRLTTAKAKAILIAFDVIPRHSTRVESEITDVLLSTFRDVTPTLTQHVVGPYRIDLYFPLLGLAIEIDEHGHDGYNLERESVRQLLLEQNLGCKFIRWNPHQPERNIGDLINSILLHMQANQGCPGAA
jgi:very-short-patch-repair endonuclease